MGHTWKAALVGLALVVGLTTGFAASEQMHPKQEKEVVCHAPTEDSFPTDCDYHDHAWYRK